MIKRVIRTTPYQNLAFLDFYPSWTHFWSQGHEILAVVSVLANIWHILVLRFLENLDFSPFFWHIFWCWPILRWQIMRDKSVIESNSDK